MAVHSVLPASGPDFAGRSPQATWDLQARWCPVPRSWSTLLLFPVLMSHGEWRREPVVSVTQPQKQNASSSPGKRWRGPDGNPTWYSNSHSPCALHSAQRRNAAHSTAFLMAPYAPPLCKKCLLSQFLLFLAMSPKPASHMCRYHIPPYPLFLQKRTVLLYSQRWTTTNTWDSRSLYILLNSCVMHIQ